MENNIPELTAADASAWREWLRSNSEASTGVSLVLYKKDSGVPCISYAEAVEEALCWGWIDSKKKIKDSQCSVQHFSPRKPKGNWSKLNKERVAVMTAQKRMMPQGIKMVELAKETGTWTALDEVDELKIPPALAMALAANEAAAHNFATFPPSAKKMILQWLLSARTQATTDKRIAETVSLAAQNIRANQYTPKHKP